MTSIRELYGALEDDPRRAELDFSEDLLQAQAQILAAGSDEERASHLAAWLASHQPCKFGSIAARFDLIEFCFLTEADLLESDEHVHQKIHEAHEQWWDAALLGQKSGFVMLALSDKLSRARPDSKLLMFAQRLGQLYLNKEEVETDRIHLDQVFLEIPDRPRSHLYRWDAGVNIFAAAADKRWWQDHRIPAGVAYSVNSVGHMVRSAMLTRGLEKLHDTLKLSLDNGGPTKVDSLGTALNLAMSTIADASETVSGRATWLVPASEVGPEECGTCPVKLVPKIEDGSHCYYRGTYHTDHTLPTVYFRDDVERPRDATAMQLDFTYLFRNTVDNPAYRTMGEGQRIRGDADSVDSRTSTARGEHTKAHRQWPTEMSIDQVPELAGVLKRRQHSE